MQMKEDDAHAPIGHQREEQEKTLSNLTSLITALVDFLTISNRIQCLDSLELSSLLVPTTHRPSRRAAHSLVGAQVDLTSMLDREWVELQVLSFPPSMLVVRRAVRQLDSISQQEHRILERVDSFRKQGVPLVKRAIHWLLEIQLRRVESIWRQRWAVSNSSSHNKTRSRVDPAGLNISFRLVLQGVRVQRDLWPELEEER